ncbi:2'-5' RNA ligase family protein [Candidatus Mycobacterium wuenschmannii]|uniref:2'-5' RNA ligase family protein n=1 Tax=Candidatus Mycobacterium wuenschmannii TaxID=3027808 RepID=A0ABY8VYQ1_9MYCO|nr:2'-5' RNA ligase family protein [Candidatus Mycobacterium wuenschmannii]WIM88770.1 2'-5' RNA ligase family protein [Candidatus Mycobacterium wuenschmannii]
MVHSVELLFDPDTEATLRRIWDDLADADLPSRLPAGRPHVTVAVAERIAPEVDDPLRTVAQQLPLECDIGAPVLFGQSNAVLARLIVPTDGLLALHAEVHRVCKPHLLPGPLPHSLPSQWTAHVTLARRIENASVGPMLRVVGQPAEIRGHLAALRRWDGTERVEYPIG